MTDMETIYYWSAICSDPDGDTDILTQLGPFGGYNSQSTCGPDPDVSFLLNLINTCH